MDSVSVRELFFIVMYTQEHGAEVISNRIREQFRSCEQLQPADLTLTVSHSFLGPIARESSEPMEIFVEKVAAGIQDLINTIRLQRSVST
jgi:hypothetical protein